MADGFGLVMAELEFAGAKFRGGKIFVILTALTTLGGGLWGGFEFYKDYLDMKDQIQNYTAPDLSGFDKRVDLVQQEVEMMQSEMSMILQEISLVSDVANELKNDLRQDVRRIEKIVNDVEQQVKEDSRENARDLKEAINNIKDDMKALEEKTDKNIKRALDNPLSKMK
jgi:archaellum component FlaC